MSDETTNDVSDGDNEDKNRWYPSVTHVLADARFLFSHFRAGGLPAWRLNFGEPISTALVLVAQDDWLTIITEPFPVELSLDDVLTLQQSFALARVTRDKDGYSVQVDIHRESVSADSVKHGLGAIMAMLGELHRLAVTKASVPQA